MVLRFIQKCPRCAGIGVAERKSDLYSFICQDCGFVTDREEAKSLFDDAYSLYLKGYGEKCSREEILVEKEKWDKVMKESKKLFFENKRLRAALNTILDATRGHCPSIAGIRFVAYTALKKGKDDEN